MNYYMHHYRCCRCVTSVSISDSTIFDPSIDPSFHPSPFLIICPIDIPSFDPIHGPNNYPSLCRGPSQHPFETNPESNVDSDNVPRVDSSTIPFSGPRTFLIVCSIELPSVDPSYDPNNVTSFSLSINAPNCVRTNDNPSRNPNLLHNDLNVVHKISLDKLDARKSLTTY